MTKVIKLGKIDYLDIGEKTCHVEIEMELKDLKHGKKEFTASGTIWNEDHTCYLSGQCLDTIAEYISTPAFKEIHRLWKRYHLNTMHAGTPKQERALNKAGLTQYATRYYDCCEYLDSIDLLYDNDYKFGTKWLYRPIPKKDLEKIKLIMSF